MHAIHGNKFFGEGVGHAVVVRGARAHQAGQGVFDGAGIALPQIVIDTEQVEDAAQFRQVIVQLVQVALILVTLVTVTAQAPPVGVHGTLEHRVGKNRRGPFHGVDFGHQGSVDQPGMVVEPLIGSTGVVRLEHVGNGVMLLGEQVMQHAQPHPPVFIETGNRFAAEEFRRQAAIAVDFQLTVHKGTHFVVGFLVAAV